MKILMVSMASLHFFRWTEQLSTSGHEVFWIDVYDSNKISENIGFAHQIVGWRYKFDFPGRYWLKTSLPEVYDFIGKFNERRLDDKVRELIHEINPDVVHSFILQSGTFPLIDVMKYFPKVKWIYSAWGNDLYFRQQNSRDLANIKKTLPHLDFMFADCDRDLLVAQKLGFEGDYLGTFPTGGGYDLNFYNQFMKPFEQRQTIIIKGYQGKLGRCINILKALIPLKNILVNYEIVVFAAGEDVKTYFGSSELKDWINIKVHGSMPHIDVLKLMGQSFLYIGNSISDGMPNTLLEAIIMGSFPIQSNPGGATEEIIIDSQNGRLIKNPEDYNEISFLIKTVIEDINSQKVGVEYNYKFIKPGLEREKIKERVLDKYKLVEENI